MTRKWKLLFRVQGLASVLMRLMMLMIQRVSQQSLVRVYSNGSRHSNCNFNQVLLKVIVSNRSHDSHRVTANRVIQTIGIRFENQYYSFST